MMPKPLYLKNIRVEKMEEFTGKYTQENFATRILLNGYFQAVEKLVAQTQNVKTALEIGCGEGYSTQRLKPFLPKDVQMFASEFEPSQVPAAQKRNPDVPTIQEDIYTSTRAANSADLVFLLEVLEHLPDPALALQKLKHISARYLILGVPNEPLWRVLNFARGKYWKDWGNTPGHINHWSSQAVANLVSREFGPVKKIYRPVPWTLLLAEKN